MAKASIKSKTDESAEAETPSKIIAQELRKTLIKCSKMSIACGWNDVSAHIYAAESQLEEIIKKINK